MGVLIGIGVPINKSTFEGGALIGRTALNQIIMVRIIIETVLLYNHVLLQIFELLYIL